MAYFAMAAATQTCSLWSVLLRGRRT